jgi:putrescine importer
MAEIAELRRELSLWDVVIYGIVLVQPIGAIALFGVAQSLSNGRFAITLLISLIGVLLSAVSYGRMAAVYPSAGSAYTYIASVVNPHVGSLAGWVMFLEYLLQPLINTIWISVAIHTRYVPRIPFSVVALLVIALITGLNLDGIKCSARANQVLMVVMCTIIVVFVVLAIRYLTHSQPLPVLATVYRFPDPKEITLRQIWGALPFAALAYTGFEGVTMLSEDVKNPRRNILLAIVIVCIFIGSIGALEAYLGQLVWPDWHTFVNLETAFMDVCYRVGGTFLSQIMGAVLMVAALGSGLTGGLGAARLLYRMGRDHVLPEKLFAHLSPKRKSPTYSILAVGILAYVGTVGLNEIGNAYQHACELLNFGAFLVSMGVNFAVFWHFCVLRRSERKPSLFADAILPLVSCAFCGLVCWDLSSVAMIMAGIWLIIGFIYIAASTRGFRAQPRAIDFSES